MTAILRSVTNSMTLLATVACTLVLSNRAQAQAIPTATGPGTYIAVGTTASLYEADYGKRLLGGGSIYVDANLTWRLGLEAEVRGLRLNQDAGSRQTTYLGGPRVSFHDHGLVPYVKFLSGVGHFNFPYGYGQGNYLVLAPGAGLDYEFNERVTLRLVNLEYQSWRAFEFGNLHPYGISAGVSLKLFRGQSWLSR